MESVVVSLDKGSEQCGVSAALFPVMGQKVQNVLICFCLNIVGQRLRTWSYLLQFPPCRLTQNLYLLISHLLQDKNPEHGRMTSVTVSLLQAGTQNLYLLMSHL